MHNPTSTSDYSRAQRLQLSLLVWALLGVTGCASAVPVSTTVHTTAASSPQSPAKGSAREAEAALLQQINTAIADAPCTTDAQCRTLELGANACGGPAAWKPWSTQHNNGQGGEKLKALATQLSALQRQRQADTGMRAICRYLPDPGATCQAQRCVLRQTPDSAS
ncbi:MAG: hypothetical protein V4858_02215 [Pseudomonadota bacterium]